MKKKLWISLCLALVMLFSAVSPVSAALNITGVEYNFDAAENENALTIKWIGRPWAEVKANEFYPQKIQGQWETIADVEDRIREKIFDLLREDIPWNQLDPEEEPALSGQLSMGEEIIGDNEYLRIWKGYFNIHIYSLDDLETPESELKFFTLFYKTTSFPAGTPYDEIYPEGWYPAVYMQ